MRKYFKAFENWLETTFCTSKDIHPSNSGNVGGRYCNPDGTARLTDAQRNAEGNGRIPTLKECLKK